LNLLTEQKRSLLAEIMSGENRKMASLAGFRGTLPHGYEGSSEEM